MSIGVLAALVLLSVLPGVAWGQSGTREQALSALADRADANARRRGARWLGDTGTMADVPALVRALRDADPGVRVIADTSLWRVWGRSGDDETDRLLIVGIAEMNEQELAAAVRTFSDVIQRTPEFAEGWNKRATVWYMLGDYPRSLADCDEVMKRNPYHYGALSGYGLIYLRMALPARALEYFEKALRVNPNLPQLEETIEALKSLLIEQRKEAT